MFESLRQVKTLPADTQVFCTHEYTEKNGQFALSVDPHNQDLKAHMKQVREKRQKNEPTVPFFLSEELKTNPFLRADTLDEFTHLRKKRDIF